MSERTWVSILVIAFLGYLAYGYMKCHFEVEKERKEKKEKEDREREREEEERGF